MPEATQPLPPAYSRDWQPEAEQSAQDATSRRHISRRNWPLWFGGALVLLVVFIAVAGPSLAPRDPLEENTILHVGGKWVTPPFSFFSVPGFPLGSDQFGRDLLSRLLWAVRPTLTMVAIVAVVRLVLGLVIGLGAGWSEGRMGRGLEAAISMALSIPVLMVALGAIAVIGVELGLIAFVIGLSITGWVETARLVRDQTQLVKRDLYVEAARALGASDPFIVVRHVVRQLMPMIWMLFAFEISSTLMTTAGLGFLGYYIGGDVWTEVSDFVARRLSGMPELGQMLASAWSEQQVITEPWAMLVAGSVVFITVLGFNLLGEGLRMRLRLDNVHRRSAVSVASGRFRAWFSGTAVGQGLERTREKVTQPLVPGLPLNILSTAIAVALVVAAVLWWRGQGILAASNGAQGSAADVVGKTDWVAARHDAAGTLWSPASGPVAPSVQWTFSDDAGFSGGPAVAPDGTIYMVSAGGALHALSAEGEALWRADLAAAGVGSPALGGDGRIYVTDAAGGVSAFSSVGDLVWRFQPDSEAKAVTGPIVGRGETVFYPAGGRLLAVSAEGQLLWSQPAPYGFEPTPPKQSLDGKLVFYLQAAYQVEDGSSYDVDVLKGKRSNEQHIVGANGATYYRSGSDIIEWRPTSSGAEVLRHFSKQIPGIPADAGVTQDGILWGSYRINFVNTESGVIWLDAKEQVLGRIQLRYDPSRVLAVDKDAIVYMCGAQAEGAIDCMALAPGSEEPLWRVSLEPGKVAGGALVDGRLYVAVEEGVLYAIGQGDANPQVGDGTQPLDGVTSQHIGPDAEVVSWTFEHSDGFVSKPVISAAGNLYIPGDDATLIALDPQGDPLWTAQLPAKPVGPPGLGADGTLYQADGAGNLSAFAPDGQLRWRFQPPEAKPATVGAVVGPHGLIYYTVAGSVQAVSPAGEGVWQTRAKTFRSYTPLQVSPSGDLLFYAEDVFDARSGALLELEAPVDVDAYLVGADGQLYLRAGNTLMQWQRSGSSVEILRTAQWNYQGLISQNSVPSQAGVTRDGTVWLLYTTPYGGSSRMVWMDLEGKILGTVQAPGKFGAAQVVGMRQADKAAFVCGFELRSAGSRTHTIDCVALVPEAEAPAWQIELGETAAISGGVLVPGRMYLSTTEGVLYAIGN